MFDVAVTAIPQLKSGAVRGLTITSAARSSAAPDIPTVAEQDLTGFEARTWNSIAAPVGMPQPIADRINVEVAAVLAAPETRKRLQDLASTFYPAWSSAQVDTFYASERAKWIPVRQAVGKG